MIIAGYIIIAVIALGWLVRRAGIHSAKFKTQVLNDVQSRYTFKDQFKNWSETYHYNGIYIPLWDNVCTDEAIVIFNAYLVIGSFVCAAIWPVIPFYYTAKYVFRFLFFTGTKAFKYNPITFLFKSGISKANKDTNNKLDLEKKKEEAVLTLTQSGLTIKEAKDLLNV